MCVKIQSLLEKEWRRRATCLRRRPGSVSVLAKSFRGANIRALCKETLLERSSASLVVVLDRYLSYIFQCSVGVRRQKVELLLPGGTDGSGYPGGIKQQFGAVRGMVEAILLQLKQLPDFQVRIMLDR